MKGYHCEGCGRHVADPEELKLRQRASGCRIWLCRGCRWSTLQMGTKPVEEDMNDTTKQKLQEFAISLTSAALDSFKGIERKDSLAEGRRAVPKEALMRLDSHEMAMDREQFHNCHARPLARALSDWGRATGLPIVSPSVGLAYRAEWPGKVIVEHQLDHFVAEVRERDDGSRVLSLLCAYEVPN